MAASLMLSDLFTEYLSKGHPNGPNDLFIKVLHDSGYEMESELLKRYLEAGDFKITDFTWKNIFSGTCFVSSQLPQENVAIGDIWFDIKELTPMILVCPDGNDVLKIWVSLHPVYTWQFNAFINIVSWKVAERYFLKVNDLLDKSRFNKKNELHFISNIYHEEAVCYAHWFGKGLLGHITLEQIKPDLTADELSMILPPDLYIWDGSEHPQSEFLRIASSQENIDTEIYEDDDSIDEEEKVQPEHNAVFKEWYKGDEISLSTAVRLQTGLLTDMPRGGYEFVKLMNAAVR